MRKSLVMAVTMLALGASSAFAGDGDVHAVPPARSSFEAQAATQHTVAHRMFSAGMNPTTNVYANFGSGGFAQGGQS